MKRAAVILAGGAGTRLRPLSSDENPKQFLRIFSGRSLIQMTFARVARLVERDAIYVSTNQQYAALVTEHVPEATLITEPARRNTAPAIALSCFAIEVAIGECVIAVLPSDHFIADEDEFLRVLGRAMDFAGAHEDLPPALTVRNPDPTSPDADPDETTLPAMVERCGPERFLWASDFPHFDASPEPVKETKEAVASLPASIQQKILGDNAAEAYQLS